MERSIMQSHPMRVRGLKSTIFSHKGRDQVVAPHPGAWIEMAWIFASGGSRKCRTPPGCVD